MSFSAQGEPRCSEVEDTFPRYRDGVGLTNSLGRA